MDVNRRSTGENLAVMWPNETSKPWKGMPPGRPIRLTTDDVSFVADRMPELNAVIGEVVSWRTALTYGRKLVPTMVLYIMRGHEHKAAGPKTMLGRFQRGFERGFNNFRSAYYQLLETTLEHRKVFAACFLAFCLLSMALVFFLGEEMA